MQKNTDTNGQQIYDFYFSEEAQEHVKAMREQEGEDYVNSYFNGNGQLFTEMVYHGQKPNQRFKSQTYIGTGYSSNTKHL
jgi:hypothetical protein